MASKMIYSGALGNSVSTRESATAAFDEKLEAMKPYVTESELGLVRQSWMNAISLGTEQVGSIIIAIGDRVGFAATELQRTPFRAMWSVMEREVRSIDSERLHGSIVSGIKDYMAERMKEEEDSDPITAASGKTLLILAALMFEMHRRQAEDCGDDPDQYAETKGAALVLFAHVSNTLEKKRLCMVWSSSWHVNREEPQPLDEIPTSEMGRA